MFNLSDTIAAVCTPKGIGAIAAIRISGPDSWKIVEKIFSGHRDIGTSTHRHNFSHMHAMHGYIKDNEKVIDEVIALPFKSPNSYTGEDVIEIFCHGGVKAPSMILDLCLKHGARIAGPGEFTFRAFVNEKVDLTEAEAINELINSCTDKAVYAASENISGSLKKKIKTFREKLFLLLASMEGAIEFPMDVEQIDRKEFISSLDNINKELRELVESSKEGQVLRDGFKVSIVGETNVGKSSLLNGLLENERVIVTDIPGTTRDIVEEKIIIDGWPVILVDTAGIREHQYLDKPEKSGIQRTELAINRSDIILFITDLSKNGKNGEKNLLENLIKSKPKIVVGNKVDLLEQAPSPTFRTLSECDVTVSAKYGTNMTELKRLIVEKVKNSVGSSSKDCSVFVNGRQKELLIQTCSTVEFALETVKSNSPDDFVADELKKAISKLDQISGQNVNEEVVKSIFANFCIGK